MKEHVKGCFTRNQICQQVAERHHVPSGVVKQYMLWIFGTIGFNLIHRYATQLIGFGKFTNHLWPKRYGHWPPSIKSRSNKNHQSPKRIIVPARDVPIFKASIKLKRRVRYHDRGAR